MQRLEALPSHLLILGGGYVALEFAQLFRRFGCEVTIVERGPQLLSREDPDIATAVAEMLQGEGIKVLLNSTVTSGARRAGAIVLEVSTAGDEHRLAGSHLLAATGRGPNTGDLNLAAVGVRTDDRGFIEVNERLETSAPDIWALGDCNGGPQFTHASLDDYRIVKANVFGGGARTTKDRLVPASLFADPELARVGLTESEARRRGLEIRIARVPASVVPRAKTSGHTTGLMKAIVDAKTERILGCAIFAAQAGEAISTVQMTTPCGTERLCRRYGGNSPRSTSCGVPCRPCAGRCTSHTRAAVYQ
ncbi:MAG: FAD-dependent oxidoreductase [Opitutaceae bacterium]